MFPPGTICASLEPPVQTSSPKAGRACSPAFLYIRDTSSASPAFPLQAKRKRSAFPCFCHPVSLQFPDSCASPLPDLPTGRCFVVLLPGRPAPAASLLLLLSTQETREKGLMLTSAACTVSRRSSEGVNVFPLKVTEAICTP